VPFFMDATPVFQSEEPIYDLAVSLG